MADGIEFDLSGVRQLAADISELQRTARPNVRKAVEFTSRKMKDTWRESAASKNRGYAKRYPQSIDYDVTVEGGRYGAIVGEIGPNLSKQQGQLGFLEDAPGGVRAAPQGNDRRALRENIDDFETGILKATGSLDGSV